MFGLAPRRASFQRVEPARTALPDVRLRRDRLVNIASFSSPGTEADGLKTWGRRPRCSFLSSKRRRTTCSPGDVCCLWRWLLLLALNFWNVSEQSLARGFCSRQARRRPDRSSRAGGSPPASVHRALRRKATAPRELQPAACSVWRKITLRIAGLPAGRTSRSGLGLVVPACPRSLKMCSRP